MNSTYKKPVIAGLNVRSVLIDVFKEAQHAGEASPGYNPALATKQPRRKVTRERHVTGYCYRTAPGDISEMKFRDIWDDHLYVIRQKTGTRLAIPLSLRCQALNISLRDVIAGCRDLYASKYLVHYTRNTSQSQPGGQVTANTLTTNFKKPEIKPISIGEKVRQQHFMKCDHYRSVYTGNRELTPKICWVIKTNSKPINIMMIVAKIG